MRAACNANKAYWRIPCSYSVSFLNTLTAMPAQHTNALGLTDDRAYVRSESALYVCVCVRVFYCFTVVCVRVCIRSMMS